MRAKRYIYVHIPLCFSDIIYRCCNIYMLRAKSACRAQSTWPGPSGLGTSRFGQVHLNMKKRTWPREIPGQVHLAQYFGPSPFSLFRNKYLEGQVRIIYIYLKYIRTL